MSGRKTTNPVLDFLTSRTKKAQEKSGFKNIVRPFNTSPEAILSEEETQMESRKDVVSPAMLDYLHKSSSERASEQFNQDEINKEVERQKKLEPQDELEEILKQEMNDDDKFLEFKKNRDKIAELEKRDTKFFDGNVFNLFAPLYWLHDSFSDEKNKIGMNKAEHDQYKKLINKQQQDITPALQKLKAKYDESLPQKQSQFQLAYQKEREEDITQNAEAKKNITLGDIYINTAKGAKQYLSLLFGNTTFEDMAGPIKESEALKISMRYDEQNLKRINDFLEGKNNVWDGLNNNKRDLKTIGILSTVEDFVTSKVAEKVDKVGWNNLSNHEKELLKSYAKKQQVEDMDLMTNRFFYKTGDGTGASLVFLEGMVMTGGFGGVAKGATQQGIKGLIKQTIVNSAKKSLTKRVLLSTLRGGYKTLPSVAEVTAASLLSPSSYGGYSRKRLGSTEIIQDKDGNEKVLVRDSIYKSFLKDYKINKDALEKEKSKYANKPNLNEDEKAYLDEINASLQNLDEELDILRPKSQAESFIYGITETMKEYASEKFVGQFGAKLSNKFVNSRVGKAISSSKIIRPFKYLNEKAIAGKHMFNNSLAGKISNKAMYHSGVAKLYNGVPGEILEEIAVQVTPTYQENYMKQFKELRNPSFYADIVAQTLLMGGGVTTLGMIGQASNFRKNRQLYDNRQAVRDTYRRIDSAINDDDLAETIVMSTGGTGFSIADYNYRIHELRQSGKKEEADKLEQKKFYNLAVTAIRTNTLDEFENSLNNVSKNENISSNTKVNIELAKENINTIKAVYEKYQDKPNVGEILNLASQKITNKQSLNELDMEIGKQSIIAQEEIDALIKRENLSVNYSMSTLLDRQFENEEEASKYDEFLDKIQAEKNTAIDTYLDLSYARTNLEHANYVTMKNFNEQTHPSYIQNLNNQKIVVDAYSEIFEELEKGNLSSPNLEFNYQNKLQQTPELIDEIVDTLKEQYEGFVPNEVFEKIRTTQKQNIENNKQQEKIAHLTDEQQKILDKRQEENKSSDAGITESMSIPVVDDISENEFSSTMNELMDNITFAAEDILFEINDNEFDEMLGEGNYTPEQLKSIKENVKAGVENIESKLGRKPSFREMMEQMYKYTPNEEKVKKIFNHIVKGWQENNYTPDNYQEVYNDLFNPFEEGTSLMRDAIFNMFESELEVSPKSEFAEIEDKTKNIEKQIAASQSIIVTYDEENMAITKTAIEEIESKRTLNIAPKLGFSALQYEEEIENGVLVRKSKGSVLNINEDKLVDFRDLLNPDKHKSGDKLNVEIADESLWSQITVSNGRNIKGEALTTNFEQWVKDKEKTNPSFRNTLEFKNKVPMFYTDKNGNRLAYVQDTDWYNPFNVGNPFSNSSNPNMPTQEWYDYIQQGKQNTQSLRENIHRGLKEVTINRADDGVFYTIPEEEPYITINESNPQSIIAVQRGDQLFIGNQSFNAGTLLNTNNKGEKGKFDLFTENGAKQNGHTWMINRIGFTTNDKGEQVPSYRAYPILRKVQSEQIETVKWGLAAHLTLKGYNKEIKGTPYEMSIDQARRIQKDINSNMGYNIDNPKEITNFIKTYFQTKLQGDNISSYRALLYGNENIEDHIVQHTNSGLLGANIKSIVHIENAMVNPLNQKYEDYLKNTLYTNIKSFDVDTTGKNPIYATVIQPIINIQYNEIPETKSSIELRQEAVNQVVEELQKENPTFDINKHIDFLNSIGVDFNSFEDGDYLIENVDKLANIFKIVGNLNISQEKAIRQFIVHNIGEKVSFEYKAKVSEAKLKAEIKSDLDLIFKKLENQINSLLKDIDNSNTNDTRAVSIKEAYNNTLENIKSIDKNFDAIFNKSFKDIQRQTQLVLNEENDNEKDDIELVVKDYNKDSIEESGKAKASYRLRRFLHKIPKYDNTGKIKTTYLGLPEYMSFNDVYNELSKVLAMGSEVVSDYNFIITKLKNSKSPFIKDVLNKLEGADQQIKNEFVYNFVRHSLSSKFAMYETDKYGTSLKIYDTNSNEAVRTIDKKWKNENRASSLYNKDLSFNTSFAEKLINEYENWDKDYTKVDQKELRNWLKDLGITFEDNAWKQIYTEGIFNSQKQNSFNILYTQDKGGLFVPIVKFLKAGINNADTHSHDAKQNIFSDLGGVMKALAMVEANYNSSLIALSFRDSGKNISTQVPTKYVTDMVQNLKRSLNEEGNNLIDDLQSISYSENSIILNLLKNEPAFKNIFEISHLGLTAVKERGDNPSKSSITDLGEIDYDLAVLGGFMDRKIEKISDTTKINGISLRIANMMFPTMSDKTTGLYLKTAVFDFMKDSSLMFEEDAKTGKIKFSSELRDLLFNQLVLPELNRIIKFHQEVKSTNIKNYDNGAMIFHLIPKLNTIKDEAGINLIEKLATLENYTLDDILDKYKTTFENAIEDVVNSEVQHKKNLWSKYSDTNKQGETYSTMFDTKYFTEVGKNPAKDYDVAVYDFVLNSLLFNSEVFKVFAGDIANYSQDKLYKENGKKVNAYQIENASNYISLNKEIGVNLGKRLALLIAPGNKIANSYNEMYNQIFLEDSIDISENSAYLIKNYYGEDSLTKAEPILTKIKEKADLINKHEQGLSILNPDKVNELKSSLGNLRSELSNMFPDLDAYFDIESTDAQEYTTATEHVSVLHRMGRISDSEFKAISTKLLTAGTGGYLTKEELNLVLQPIKPVHTGTYINKDFDINRVVYIKSSSFPLIPQLTAGTKLDALRNKMEELESNTGRFTRASFQTANKVGATKKTINPFDINSLNDIKEYSSNDINAKVLVLNRNNFRIQQDVPFKSDKKQDDKVSMGTQFFKLLFGDGMIDINDYELDGKSMTGQELYNHFNESFKNIVDSKKQELFLDLGLSNTGAITNEVNFIKKLQDLLVKEATGRGYSVKSLAGLKIEQLAAKAGYYYEFKTPLWLSSDSNRYESLLNSIITNRIMKHKLPGNGFVAGSESGFRFKEDFNDVDKSRIIFLDNWNGVELQGVHTTNEEGTTKFHKAQVFVPSKFKNDKKELVDLFEDFNGNEGKYIYRRENGSLGLKEGMIDRRLFNNFSFRTPTSSHVSGSTIEIAGILPPEVGDLMIVPKNFTKQKGLDYDIDKESAYQLNHLMTKDGKIKVLESSDIENLTKGLQDIIDKFNFDNLTLEKKYKLFEQIQNLGGGLFDEEGLEELTNPQNSVKEKLYRAELQLKRKLAENEFIKSHLAVFNNPNSEVQKKINKILSIDFAKSQAEAFEKLNAEGAKNKIINDYINDGYSPLEAEKKFEENNLNFTMLTYTYQKNKMSLGSIGKIAIGVYANYTTFNGLLQQNKNADVFIQDEEGNPKELQIGRFISDGKLGKDNSIAPVSGINEWKGKYQRTTSEVFAEKENTATDNEKEQVLGRVGVNEFTINIDAHMTLRGFDKDENGNSISYLLLSQPIIRELNNRRKESRGILGEFQKDEKLINDLIQEYGGNSEFSFELGTPVVSTSTDSTSRVIMLDNSSLTGNALLEGIEFNGRDKMIQLLVLNTYLDLEKEAKAVSNIQKTINANTLGKSMIESQLKYEGLKNIHKNPVVANAHSLLGEFLETQGERNDGYWIGENYIVPTTPQGQIVINGLYLGNNLYKDFFPYQDDSILSIVKEILAIQGKSEVSESTIIENFEGIIENVKKYIYSRKGNNIFNIDPRAKRYELFIDDANNISLSTYIKDLMKDDNTSYKKGVKSLSQNTLIKSFTFETGRGENELSLIKYNNAATDNLDEEDLYNSIPELVLMNLALPPRNGQPYSTRQLAEDLVAYSFLEGGVQEATQFVKFVPIEFLESVGQYEKMKVYENGEIVEKDVFVPANRKLQAFNSKKNKDIDIFKTALGMKDESASVFTKQYFQHNPAKAPRISKPKSIGEGLITYVDNNDKSPAFVSVKNKKDAKEKYSLYEHIGNGTYQLINTLGDMGISEYEYRNENVVSLKNDKITVAPKIITDGDKFGLNQLNITEKSTFADILKQISEAKLDDKYSHLSEASKWLLPMIKNQGKLILDETLPGAGRAAKTSLNITMNPNMTLNISDEATAMTFVHELIHTISRNELDKYFDEKGISLKGDIEIPTHVRNLFVVFNEFRNKVKSELDVLESKMTGKADASLGTDYTEREKGVIYAGKNIREFLAVALTSPLFQEEMNKVEYKKSGETVWERFKKVILDVLANIYPALKENSIAKESILNSLNFIKEEFDTRRKAEIQKLLPNDIQYQLEQEDSNLLMYGNIDTKNEVDNIPNQQETESDEDNMIENSLFQEDILNLPDCL